jgi:phosphatidylinositol alpha-1,6-mannosyltransferase
MTDVGTPAPWTWILLTPHFWPERGGVQRYLGAFCDSLAPETVHVVAPAAPVRLPADPGLCPPCALRRVPDRRPFRLVLTFAIAARVKLASKRTGVIVGMCDDTGLVGIALKRLWGCPLVAVTYGRELVVGGWLRTRIRRLVLGAADHVIAVSSFTAAAAVREGATNVPISILTPSAATPAAVEPPATLRRRHGLVGARVLLTVSRLDSRKNHATVLRALGALCHTPADVPPLRYVIVGDGPERTGLEELVERLQLGSRVVFTGTVSDSELHGWYQAADLFVLPSLATPDDVEGFGIVYAEAALAGTPVIAAKGGGVEDAVMDGVTGIVLPSADIASVHFALGDLLSHPSKLSALGAGCQDWIAPRVSPLRFQQHLRAICADVCMSAGTE